MRRLKESYEQGYADGMRDGAGKNRNAAPWNLPDARPKHMELIGAVVTPYDRKTARYCRKRGLRYCKVDGMYLDGAVLGAEYENEDGEEIPDMILVSPRDAVVWENAVLWISEKFPEGFSLTEEQ